MAYVEVHFQDGFEHDRASVRLNGREVWSSAALHTRTQISYADQARIEVPEGTAQLAVEVVGRGAVSVELPAAPRPLYVGVSLIDGRLTCHLQSEPFGYA
ncbi:MAG: hypothetical protein SF182_22090 [Deltaproteobacteria bacterium]|nr:hypothetical protein [Deltaproteobacteria bacterium]